MKLKLIVAQACLWLCLQPGLRAQEKAGAAGPWKDIQELSLAKPAGMDARLPEQYRLLEFEPDVLRGMLAPLTPDFSKKISSKQTLVIALPMPDGGYEHFTVYSDPIMHPDLARKYPEIQSWAGRGVEDPTASLRMDLSPKGFNAQILSDKRPGIYIAPVIPGDSRHNICYFKKDNKHAEGWTCHTLSEEKELKPIEARELAGDCGVRHEYRLALSCSGEYAGFQGGTVLLALAAMNTTMNRVNGVFQRECAIRMNLIADNDQLVYLDGATDPFSDQLDAGATINDNQANTDAVIGDGDYDIGHVFTLTAAGNPNGLAQHPAACIGGKARAVTGSDNPTGDAFDIDFVAHEMGHQFDGSHTQYNGCNRNDATAVEPGSASTIMGYAGICSPDVQPHSDDYFHAVSIVEIRNYVATGSGSTCDNAVSVSNSAPSVAPVADYTIPGSTPFVLTASGSDPDGNPLSYCWEQVDAFSAPAQTMPPASANTTGPMFRSIAPTASPKRYFPALNDLLSNTNSTWEELPSVGRTMRFTVTVRDQVADGGCTAETGNTVTVAGTAGPFVVTGIGDDPNCLYAGDNTTVHWNVANTTAAPVNCANVDIWLSLDGGQNFSILLADDTPNDGAQSVVIPASAITQHGRIMVAASGNIFFDVNNNDVRIDCPLNRVVSDNPASGVYRVRETLETSGPVNVLPGTTARFYAGQKISLKPGFHAHAGSDFLAKIRPCDPCTAPLQQASIVEKQQNRVYFYDLPVEERSVSNLVSPIRAFAFPNPFDRSFTLQFELPTEGPTEIRLTDSNGKLLQTPLPETFMEAGSRQITVNLEQLSGGVYYCHIISNGFRAQVKLIKI